MELKTSIQVSTGHRLHLHDGNCSNFHGHNYDIKISINFENLNTFINKSGYIIDFGNVKKVIKAKFDHKFLLFRKDPLVDIIKKNNFPGFVIVDYSPTAENISRHVVKIVKKLIQNKYKKKVKISVDLWETENSHIVSSI